MTLGQGNRFSRSVAVVRIGICRQHRLNWWLSWGSVIPCWLLVAVLGALMVNLELTAAVRHIAAWLTLLLIVAPFIATWWTRPVRIAQIEPQFLWLKGVHFDYLRNLPPRR